MSATKSGFSKAIFDVLYFAEKIKQDIAEHMPEFECYADANLLSSRLSVLKVIMRSHKYNENVAKFNEIKKKIFEARIPENCPLSLKRKFEYYSLKTSNYLYMALIYLFDLKK